MSSQVELECPNAANHTPGPVGYLSYADWAYKMLKTHRQARCPGCNKWVIWTPRKDLREATRVYLPRGRVAHLLPPWESPNTPMAAFCGRYPTFHGEIRARISGEGFWLGTGSQGEIECANQMATCKPCAKAFLHWRKNS